MTTTNMFLNFGGKWGLIDLLLYTTHSNTCYVLLVLLAVHYTHQHMLCIVAISDYTTHISTHAMYCCYY